MTELLKLLRGLSSIWVIRIRANAQNSLKDREFVFLADNLLMLILFLFAPNRGVKTVISHKSARLGNIAYFWELRKGANEVRLGKALTNSTHGTFRSRPSLLVGS